MNGQTFNFSKGSDCLTWSEVYDNKTNVDRIKKANDKKSNDALLLLQDFKDRFPEVSHYDL